LCLEDGHIVAGLGQLIGRRHPMSIVVMVLLAMPGVAALTPAWRLGLSVVDRTTPGLIFLYSFSGADISDVPYLWSVRPVVQLRLTSSYSPSLAHPLTLYHSTE
jgi:hypothetical protein